MLYVEVETVRRALRASAMSSKSLASFATNGVNCLSAGAAVRVRRYFAVARKLFAALSRSAAFCERTALFQTVTALFDRELALTHELMSACDAPAFVVVGAAGVEVALVDDVVEVAPVVAVEVLDAAVVLEVAVADDEVAGVADELPDSVATDVGSVVLLALLVVLLVDGCELLTVLVAVLLTVLVDVPPPPVHAASASVAARAMLVVAARRGSCFRNIRPPCNALVARTKSACSICNRPSEPP